MNGQGRGRGVELTDNRTPHFLAHNDSGDPVNAASSEGY